MADIVVQLDPERGAFLEEEDDADLQAIKSHATTRKGRGFQRGFEESSFARSNEPFDHMADQAGDGGPGPQRSVEGWILFVTGIHEEAQEDDVHDKFSEYGTIKNLHMNLDRRTGFIKGYALVEFETFREAQRAKDTLNATDLLGQQIFVDWAFVQASHRERSRR